MRQIALHGEAKRTLKVPSILEKQNPFSKSFEITIAGMHEMARSRQYST
jgi:hypothetical protein